MAPSEHQLQPAEAWWTNSFMVTFAFRCNIACTFCMVEDALGVFEGTTLASFRAFADDPRRLRGASRIIFSGGEVTLAKDLLDYVAVARTLPGVRHVRIQTNAIRLADRVYLRSLLDAGIDEFFVSFHAPDAVTYDAIAQRKGSFGRILEGLSAIREAGATLITNTAIVLDNFRLLPAIVELASSFGPRSIEMWNYWPRGDDEGARMLAARVSDVREPLIRALELAVAKGIPPVVKWFPRCLLGTMAWCQDDGQPPALIEDRYWEKEPAYGCLYEGVCAESMGQPGRSRPGKCAGLSDAYVHRFGWEERTLRPVRTSGEPVLDPAPSPSVARSLIHDAGPRRAEQAHVAARLSRLGITRGQTFAGHELTGFEASRDGAAVTLGFRDGHDTVAIAMCATDSRRASSAKTKSFDLFFRPKDEAHDLRAAAVADALVAQISPRDEGGLTLR